MQYRQLIWVVVQIVVLSFLLVACAPIGPVTTPTPVALQPTPSTPALVAPTLTLEEAAWSKVVQAAKNEGKLTIYSYWSGDANLKLQKAFNDRFGIWLEVIVGKGGTHLERLLTEKRTGKMVADTIFSSPIHILRLRELGMTVSLSELPVFKEQGVWVLRPDSFSSDKQFISTALISYPSVVNTKLMSPAEAPHSYKDLLGPAWKGKMIIASPINNTAMYSMFVPLLNRGIVDMDFIKNLGKQELLLAHSGEAAVQSLARGERPFLIMASDVSLYPSVSEGAPIKTVALDEGTTVQLSGGGAVIKDSPHPNAAKLFMNWIMTKEGHDVYNQALGLVSLRKDVKDYVPAAAQFVSKKLIETSLEELEQENKMFGDRVFAKLWGQ